MNYADAVATGDIISILTAKKRILSNVDPENKYHSIYEISTNELISVDELVSQLLTIFVTKILPNSKKPLNLLLNQLDNISVDLTHLENSGNFDIPILKILFPNPFNNHIESINLLLQNSINLLNLNLNLKRIYPRMPLFVVQLNSLSLNFDYIIDLEIEKNDNSGILAYALIAGDIIQSDSVQLIS